MMDFFKGVTMKNYSHLLMALIVIFTSSLAMAQSNKLNNTNTSHSLSDSQPLVSNIKPVDFKTFHLAIHIEQQGKSANFDLDLTNHEAETTHIEENGLAIDYYFKPEMEHMDDQELPLEFHIASKDMTTQDIIEKKGLIELKLNNEPIEMHVGQSLITFKAHENHTEF